MRKLLFLLIFCASGFCQTENANNIKVNGILTVVGDTSFGGPDPYYDVRKFGAKCDGTTDDTTAIQAALTAANSAHGGTVWVPVTTQCVIASSIALDNFQNVRLTSAAQSFPFQGASRGGLKFTGTSGPLISCKSCFGVHIDHLLLQYTGAFSGVFIEFGHSGLGFDSFENYVGYNFIGKAGAGGSAVLISLDQADANFIEGNQLEDGAIAIRGRNAPSGAVTDYSNNNTIQRNTFGSASYASFSTAFIQNLGTANVVQGNDFEIGASGVSTMSWSGAMASSGSIIGNWDGDMTGAATFTKYAFPANSKWHVSGNLISATSANVSSFSLGNTSALSIYGNTFAEGSTFGTFLTVGTGDSVNVGANAYGTFSAFLSGTPANGSILTDNSGVTTIYGAPTITGTLTGVTGNFSGTVTSGAGSGTSASYGFTGHTNIGWYLDSNLAVHLAFGGPNTIAYSGTLAAMGSGYSPCWSSNIDPSQSGCDVGISRSAAGVVSADTTAAANGLGKYKAAAYTTTANCSSSASPAVCGSAAAGSFVIAAAGTSVTVNTSAVTANSQIFVQEDESLGTKLGVTCNTGILANPPAITARSTGVSFAVGLTAGLAVNPVCFSYWIVN